jgi:hypothetical protein
MAKRDLKRVERAACEVEQAREHLGDAIVLPHDSGETFEDIGRAAGISRQRVQ